MVVEPSRRGDRKSILSRRRVLGGAWMWRWKRRVRGNFWRIFRRRDAKLSPLSLFFSSSLPIHLLYMALNHLDVKTTQHGVSSSFRGRGTLFNRVPLPPTLQLWHNTLSNSYRWAIISGKFRKIAVTAKFDELSDDLRSKDIPLPSTRFTVVESCFFVHFLEKFLKV